MRCYRAYAKLNLTLDIVGLLPNGYHAMDMLMQSIALHDTLGLERAEELSLRVEGGNLSGAPENLVPGCCRSRPVAARAFGRALSSAFP